MSRPGTAALLSAFVPGLGQARLGARRRAALIAIPFIGLILVAAIAVIVDPRNAANTVLSPGVLVAGLVLLVAMGAYHVLAVVDAFRLGNRVGARQEPPVARRRAVGSPLLLIALTAIVGLYGVAEFVGVKAYQATQAIFVDPGSGLQIPSASFSPRPSSTNGASPSGPVTAPPPPSPTPVPVPPWADDGRLNLLLIGSDAGPGRWLARTDTMIVLSIDIETGRAALFGIPRNLINVPLPPESAGAFPNGRFPEFLNGLYVYAYNDARDFPGADGDTRGFRAVTGAIQELVGQPLDGAIFVNLNGFVDLVDAIGGLWVDQPYSVHDTHYPLPNGAGYIEITLPAGCHKLNGAKALEYARSRHQDSDYGRMQRQQRVLVALARQLDPIALLPRVPDLLDIAKQNVLITVPANELPNLAVLAARVDTGDIQTIQLSPPTYPESLRTKDIGHIHDRFATVFDHPPTASPSPTQVASAKPCPRT
jgi:LCP family protein required for cell wall assembly